MTLDLSVLGIDGKPEQTISMSLDVHTELIDAATKHNFWTLNRLTDYYSNNVLFGFEEFDEMLEQINLLRNKQITIAFRNFLFDFEKLIQFANSKRTSIEVLTD